MRVGESVLHPDFGRGRVVEFEQRGASYFARVDFGYAKKVLAVDQLKGEGPSMPSHPCSKT